MVVNLDETEARIATALERLSQLLKDFPKNPENHAPIAPASEELHDEIGALKQELEAEKEAHEALKILRQADRDELDAIIARFESETNGASEE